MSDNPYDHPVIIPNYYNDPQDFKPIIEGIKAAKVAAAAFTKYNTTFYDNTIPTCREYEKGEFSLFYFFVEDNLLLNILRL